MNLHEKANRYLGILWLTVVIVLLLIGFFIGRLFPFVGDEPPCKEAKVNYFMRPLIK